MIPESRRMPSTQPSVAVTGASGFVGRHLCQWLIERGYRVRGISRSGWDPGIPGLELVRLAGGARVADLRSAFGGADAVVHLAARAHVLHEMSADAEAIYHTANVELTRLALHAAADTGCTRFVYSSSVKAVGEWSDRPWTEATPPRPADVYGRSKLEAERVATEESRRLGLRTMILRFPAIYGPEMRANMRRLFRTVDRGIPLPFAAVANRRSLLYVGNACAAIERSLITGLEGPEVFFVSDGHDVSTADLIRAVAGALGRPARLFSVPSAAIRLAGRLGDRLAWMRRPPLTSSTVERLLGSLQVDISRIRALLGYTPPFTFEEGIRLTAEWFRSLDRNRA